MGQPNLLLKQARLNVGLTQEEVAEELNVKVNTYSSWECGDHKPYLRFRRALAPIFKMSIEQVNALFGESGFPSGNGGTPAGTIELKDASEYREQQNKYLQSRLDSRLLSIVDAGAYTDQREAFAQIMEQFGAMNTENPEYEMTRRKAVIGLATFPFVPPINLEKRERVSPSYYELFVKECGASLTACNELAHSSDPDDLWLAFRCVCRYLVELEIICNSLSRYRHTGARVSSPLCYPEDESRLGSHWQVYGASLCSGCHDISRESGNICWLLSAYSDLAWAYVENDERELALETARDARDLLEEHEKHKGRLPICIRGGTYMTLVDYAGKKWTGL